MVKLNHSARGLGIGRSIDVRRAVGVFLGGAQKALRKCTCWLDACDPAPNPADPAPCRGRFEHEQRLLAAQHLPRSRRKQPARIIDALQRPSVRTAQPE